MISGAVFIGLVLSMLIIYWLHPLNSGAIGLVVVMCVGGCTVIGRWRVRKRKR